MMNEELLVDERPNVEQARAWNGPDGANWVENEDFYNEASRYLTPLLIDAAEIAPTDRVLDIGCGNGETTRLAAHRGASAFGIDLSSSMVARARERAREEDLTNLRFVQGDAQIYPLEPDAFDVSISRNGVMFFDDPVAAFINIARATVTGGRLAILCWRDLKRNEWVSAIRDALAGGRSLPDPPPHVPGPFAFADSDHVRAILDAAGFDRIELTPIDEPLYMGPDASRAFDRVSKIGVVIGLLQDLGESARATALENLRVTISHHETTEGVLFGSGSWLVRASKAH
jgi:SAM-dependent methyltransferase